MELSFSPDVSAFWCYLIVGVLGAWVAGRQIQKRFGGIGGIWFQRRTWILFIAYLAVPVGLFWLLDRTDAIPDTSLFAAVLVGVGYERIIAGQSGTLRAPGDISQFWTPFLAYANSVERKIREKIDRNQSRVDERVIRKISATDQSYTQFLEFARSRVADAAALQAQLDTIDQNAAGQGPGYVRERKARIMYGMMIVLPDGYNLMFNRGIINSWLYYWHVRGVGPRIRSGLFAFLLLAFLAGVVAYMYPGREAVAETYYLWRFGKTNSTKADQYRMREGLIEVMGDPQTKQQVTSDIVWLVRSPGFPLDRIDVALQLLLEDRDTNSGSSDLLIKLVQGLRSDSPDARSRVNEVLRYLAKACTVQLDASLDDWKPSDGDSTAALELIINAWDDFSSKCQSPMPIPASVPIPASQQYDALVAENQALKAQLDTSRAAQKFVEAGDVLFPEGAFQLGEAGQVELTNNIAPKLRGLQNAKVVVYGYTDNTPVGPALQRQGIPDNLVLSTRRAATVVAFLISQGVYPNLISAKGFGETHPVLPNDTPQGRAQNRRIEITIQGPGAPDGDSSSNSASRGRRNPASGG
jgi:chemotaxis protein MotB